MFVSFGIGIDPASCKSSKPVNTKNSHAFHTRKKGDRNIVKTELTFACYLLSQPLSITDIRLNSG